MRREFTASVYVMEEDRTLLVYHKKLKKWVCPGGHIDPNEIPSDAAVREAFEETGIHVELMEPENIWIDRPNAVSIKRPFVCLLLEVPAYGNQPAHQHIDFIFVGRPVGGSLKHNREETDELRWFSYEELLNLPVEVEIFQETLDVLQCIFSRISHTLSANANEIIPL